MSIIQRLVARLGLAADVPTLITGEFGWDTDVKVLRVGDATPTPVRIMSTKSTGNFDFSTTGTVTFNNIALASGAKVQGLDLASLNAAAGIVVRSSTSGQFLQVGIVSGDATLTVTNGTGVAGDIDIRLSPTLVASIAAITPTAVTASAVAPTSPNLGDFWYNTTTSILYVRITNGTTQLWQTLSSTSGSGGQVYTQATAPTTPSIGSFWFDTTTSIVYIRANNGSVDMWMDISSTGGSSGSSITEASAAEVAAGAVTGKYVSPANLANQAAASLTARGTAQIASTAEVTAGTDSTKIVTPSALATRLAALTAVVPASASSVGALVSATVSGLSVFSFGQTVNAASTPLTTTNCYGSATGGSSISTGTWRACGNTSSGATQPCMWQRIA